MAFKNAEPIEEIYNKDLSEFNLEQAKELDITHRSIYEKYFNWCMEEAFISVSVNPYEILKHI